MLVLGIIEFGRFFAIYISAYSASREAARYGSVVGDNGSGLQYFEDCAGIKAAAVRVGILAVNDPNQVEIWYDHGPGQTPFDTACPPVNEVNLGDRVVVRITASYKPIAGIVSIPRSPLPLPAREPSSSAPP